MDFRPNDPERSHRLRRKAEAFLRQSPALAARVPVQDTRSLVEELQLYQIELELQNEELRVAQAQLSTARDRYRDLYDFAPVGYLTVDDDGVITEANLTASTLLATDRARLIGRRLVAFVALGARDAYEACWTAARETNRHSAELEFQLEDHHRYDMRVDLMRVQGENRFGGPWRLVLSDVTARRRLEADRARLDAHVQQIEKLHSLQVLAGGVAHDFNNLLTIIVGSASTALGLLSAGAPIRVYLEEIDLAAARAVNLTDQMLAYAGRTTIAVGPLNMSELIREMESLLRAVGAKTMTFELRLAEDLPSIIANRTQIQQVVLNLVTNASESLGGGSGVVRIRTTGAILAASDLAAFTHAEEATPGEFVRLDVIDTGAGMSDETQMRMFEPFFSTKLAGRGLGLAAALGIVNRHRGAIDVHSAPGHGARISVVLPITPAEALPVSLPQAAASRRLRGTVLVVDDERGVRWLALRVLGRAGLRVLEAADGRQAIDVCRNYGTAIDVIVLDQNMPGLTTRDVLREIAIAAPVARIVLSSGFPPGDGTLPAECEAFLQKPYSGATLVETVRLVLRPPTDAEEQAEPGGDTDA